MDFKPLLQYCETDNQRATVQAIIDHGSTRKAAVFLGRGKSTIAETLDRVKKRAAKSGYSPEHNIRFPLAEFEKLSGRSALVDERTGATVLQWYKTSEDKEKTHQALIAAVNALSKEVEPCSTVRKPPRVFDDLLSCYVLTDYHLGMLAWHKEGGADWDLTIAKGQLYRWIDEAIAITPNSKRAVFAQLGDFLHFDGLVAMTPTSGNILDADSRFPKIVEAAVCTLRHVVNRLLQKHEQVHVLMAEGNHDLASSVWLRVLFAQLYADNPRVTIDRSSTPYYCVEHGKTSLFFHHGHMRKPDQIAEVMAAKFREVIGRTKYSYAHMGHQHHAKLIETPLMIVEQHQTLAAKDAHSSRHGYHADRSAQVITYHADRGEVSRVRIAAS
jgi:hypothetical protein